jgi:hypothetical protein
LLVLSVPDKRRRILLEVVSVRRGHLGFGNLEGGGLEGRRERGGQFTSNLRPRWTDPVTARRVPSKWKGNKGSKGNEQGEMGKARGMRHVYTICVHVHNECLNG